MFGTPSWSQHYFDGNTTSISALADTFYKEAGGGLFWFRRESASAGLRSGLILLLKERCALQGLDDQKYLSLLPGTKRQTFFTTQSADSLILYDHTFTEAALSYFMDLYQGDPVSRILGSDELSGKYLIRDQQYIIQALAGAKTAVLLKETIDRLEPVTPAYSSLRREQKKQISWGSIYRDAKHIG